MAKKFVRGITDVKTITNQCYDTNNVNDLLSDGQYNYIHRKKGENEEYHNLTDNIKTISSDNTDLLTVTNNNKTNNTATLSPKHDTQKEQVLESERNTVTIQHGTNTTTEKTKVDTNPLKVLEHENLISDSEYITLNHQTGDATTHIQAGHLKEELNRLYQLILSATGGAGADGLCIISHGNITTSQKEPPYDNLNTLPKNSIVTYSSKDNVENCPDIVKTGFTIMCFTGSTDEGKLGSIQICYTPEGKTSFRAYWIIDGSAKWSDWKDITSDNNSIKSHGNMNKSTKPAPYDNLNTLPKNSIVTYSSKDNVENCPDIVKTGFTIMCFTGSTDGGKLGSIQICYTPEGKTSFRVYWIIGGSAKWSDWKNIGIGEETDKYPLALELFENTAVIGDSFSSGELIPSTGAYDYYNISWIQLLARKHGLKATNYSRGGLRADTWLTSEYGLQKMNQDTPKDLYFIYLGINDNIALSNQQIEIGSAEDIGTENDTFYGNYSKIINNVKTKAPHAKIAIVNMYDGTRNKLYQHINTIAEHFNLPILDLSKDALTSSPDFVSEMKQGHPQALGYATLGGAIERLLSKSFNDKKTYWIDYIPQKSE